MQTRWLPFAGLVALAAITSTASAQDVERIRPSSLDAHVARFDDDHVVLGNADPQAPLVVFLPGSNGRPENTVPMLKVVAAQGYRAIGLSYDDAPSVSQVCPRDPDPDCSARFREMRVFGTGTAKVTNPPEEAIVPRLTALLAELDRRHPADGWGGYRTEDGSPAWDRIVVSGLSQGAGMAAFIAQRFAVKRVVLFSSPWDTTGTNRRPVPWLSGPSATPKDRWWAERHEREVTTDLIAHAYAALDIPSAQILLFDRPLAGSPRGDNPFHGSTVRDTGYADQWRVLYGSARP